MDFLPKTLTMVTLKILKKFISDCYNFFISGDNLIEMLTQPKIRDETDGKKKDDDKDDDDDDDDDDKDEKDDKKESKLILSLR